MNPTEPTFRIRQLARRALGALLIASAYLPAHRLLDPARAGPPAAATRDVGEALWAITLWGSVLVAAVAALLARVTPPSVETRARSVGDRLRTLDARTVAAVAGGIALLLSGAAATLLFARLPTLADAMAQLLQARAWAAGALAAPLADAGAERAIQNGITTARGWVSIYPPGHTALLALGARAGAAWLVGPLMTAATAALTVLVARRALPERPGSARVGGALVALSPFVVLLGGGYLTHTSAAALVALSLWCALRARDGSAAWALAAGVATAGAVLSRPWTGLALGVALCVGTWVVAARARERGDALGWLSARAALWVLGGVPGAAALAAYDARFFGGALRLGYAAAFGPAHGLGLHRDPWGNSYGAREALAYSGFDLMTLGEQLFETPLSLVALVGLWLLCARAVPRGAGVLLAWALVPVAANALYWHHGYHLGPRMLYEAAPAWCVLGALATAELAAAPGWPGRAVAWAVAVALAAGLVLHLPARIEASGWAPDALARSRPPAAPADAIVFVHGSWPVRVAARLAASGMRRDSIETALRRNDLCVVDRFAAGGAGARPDFEPLPGSPPRLRSVELTPGTFARIDPSRPLPPECAREARADRLGTVELEPQLWQTPIPGLEPGGPRLYRDLGPDANARVLARHPGAPAWVQVAPSREGLLPYREAMERLWGSGG